MFGFVWGLRWFIFLLFVVNSVFPIVGSLSGQQPSPGSPSGRVCRPTVGVGIVTTGMALGFGFIQTDKSHSEKAVSRKERGFVLNLTP